MTIKEVIKQITNYVVDFLEPGESFCIYYGSFYEHREKKAPSDVLTIRIYKGGIGGEVIQRNFSIKNLEHLFKSPEILAIDIKGMLDI